ncbi:hypothetical protein Golomagni_04094 [Golovinomyces magnicellulatus]|nr:hypothetical protein Golomagni_04094 [Golovinomyces magnicellulatus]
METGNVSKPDNTSLHLSRSKTMCLRHEWRESSDLFVQFLWKMKYGNAQLRFNLITRGLIYDTLNF